MKVSELNMQKQKVLEIGNLKKIGNVDKTFVLLKNDESPMWIVDIVDKSVYN